MAHVGETELDGRNLARALWRRGWLLVLLPLAVAAATYHGLGFVEPLYTADTSILIEERESPLTRSRDDGGRDAAASFDESAIQSQVEVLRSREIADAVIDRLDLTRRPELDPATRPSLVGSLKVMLGADEHPAETTVRQRIMDSYFERLSVYPIGKSRVIGVQFSAPDPKLAADVANAVADAFVALQQDAKRESAVAATAWLEQEIERLRARVAEAEQEVADYRAANDLFASNQAGNLSTQQLGDLNAELARARAARAEAEARAQAIQALLSENGALETAEEVLDSALVQRLRERQVAIRAQIADLSTSLLPGHPRLRALQGQLANLEPQIRDEAEKIQASLSTAARIAAAREDSLLASLEEAKTAVSATGGQEIELRALEREAAAQRDLLESFLGRYREAVARTDANYLPADARIISRAVSPSAPSYPKKTLMAAAAAIAALLLVTAVLLLREFTSGRAFRVVEYGPRALSVQPTLPRRPTDRLNVPAVAARQKSERVDQAKIAASASPPPMHPDPRFDTAAAVSATAAALDAGDAIGERPGTTEIAELLAGSAVRVALFAGAEGGEGAGDIAVAAARQAARDGARFILIDLGMTPSEALSAEGEPGLGDLLAGDAAFGEVIRRDDASRVHVIPLGAIERDPPLQRLQLVIGALTHTYDKVVVVANAFADWPSEHVRPDLAAIVCGPETTEQRRTEVYEAALERGAKSALIVRYASEHEPAASAAESAAA